MITSPAAAIKQLGGSIVVTRQLGLPYTTVASWIARQSIPIEIWPRLVSIASEQGVPGFSYDALVQAHALKKPRRKRKAVAA
jgi:hypothetical protein